MVPQRRCQQVRDWLRQEGLLDKCASRQKDDDNVIAVPVRIGDDQVDTLLQSISGLVGLAKNEIRLVQRTDQKVENVHDRLRKICFEVRNLPTTFLAGDCIG